MKQKNLILLVVAVGCGLLAAFLTTQMSAKPATQEQAEMLVAAKELTIGMKIDKDKLGELIKKKKVNKNDIPLNAVLSEDELIGKQITRNLRAEDYITISDTGAIKIVVPPTGKHLYTIKLPYETVGPWVQAGREVDVVCTHRPPGSQVVRHIKLLPEVLVMAVDVDDKPSNTGTGRTVLNTVTLATSLDESHWLQLAQDAGASLRFLVRGDESEKFPKMADEELYALFNNEKPDTNKKPTAEKPKDDEPKTAAVITVKYPVTVSDAKAGTVIDDEFLTKVMQTQPFVGPAPGDVIYDLTAHKGKILTQDVPKGAYLNLNVIGEKPKALVAEVKPETPKVETPKVETRKPFKTWDTQITTGTGTKTMRFVQYEENGGWKLIGEVKEDGSVTPQAGPVVQPKPGEPAKGDTGEGGGKIS